MSTWWRVAFGFALGVGNAVANGTSLKQLGLSVLLAAFGVVSHASSTSDKSSPDGAKQPQ